VKITEEKGGLPSNYIRIFPFKEEIIIKCRDTVSHSSMNELFKEMEDLAEQGRNLKKSWGTLNVSRNVPHCLDSYTMEIWK
jgi:hypothetical protein